MWTPALNFKLWRSLPAVAFTWLALALDPIDPDAGIVIEWKDLDHIVASYNTTSAEEWLPPPSPNCSCTKLQYRALYCPWYLKPFRDPYDLVITETKKWLVSRKLLGCEGDRGMLNGPEHTGLPMMEYFGTECCRVFVNSTDAYKALSAFDPCWTAKDELQSCFAAGHRVPRELTQLTKAQYDALIRNATYADKATPHLAASPSVKKEARSQRFPPSDEVSEEAHAIV